MLFDVGLDTSVNSMQRVLGRRVDGPYANDAGDRRGEAEHRHRAGGLPQVQPTVGQAPVDDALHVPARQTSLAGKVSRPADEQFAIRSPGPHEPSRRRPSRRQDLLELMHRLPHADRRVPAGQSLPRPRQMRSRGLGGTDPRHIRVDSEPRLHQQLGDRLVHHGGKHRTRWGPQRRRGHPPVAVDAREQRPGVALGSRPDEHQHGAEHVVLHAGLEQPACASMKRGGGIDDRDARARRHGVQPEAGASPLGACSGK